MGEEYEIQYGGGVRSIDITRKRYKVCWGIEIICRDMVGKIDIMRNRHSLGTYITGRNELWRGID